ncbi:MAG: c-type cytochrome domain-containing protein, partial [Planctomycetota bacterium]
MTGASFARSPLLRLTFLFVVGFGCRLVLGVDPAADESRFTNEVAPLLERRCLSCHRKGVAEGGFSLSGRTALIESGYVDVDDVDSSHLLEVVTPQNGIAEMPKDADPLSADEIAMLRTWIAEG